MSKEALKGFQEAQVDQTNRNQARNIWYHVHQARGAHVASVRWPFELFQNALDAGPRAGRSSIDISISCRDSSLVFKHDGAPFSYEDLAALLSGGSNKGLESTETTGRFGTGYLVTHVLSERVHLIGLLQVGSGMEQFSLNLDRGGDEDAILQNMRLCSDSITAAKAIADEKTVQSATFEYPVDDAGSIDIGLAALSQALPYIYATRPKLGQVVIEAEAGTRKVWKPGPIESAAIDGGWLEYRSLQVEKESRTLPEHRIYKFMTKQEAASSALIFLGYTEPSWQVLIPDQHARRVYREYPLSGSDFLPINIVLSGKFDPDEQRRAPKMTEQDKELLKDALEAGVLAVRYAFDQKWGNAHLLARAECPATAFTPDDVVEKQWWEEQLGIFSQALARLPIVECTANALPAVVDEDDGSFADFVMPRLLPSSTEDETTVNRMWPVVRGCTELYPPKIELAEDWTTMAKGWQSLGVEVNLISVKGLADWVRGKATTFNELRVTGDKKEWLATFLDIVGECWTKRKGIEPKVLENILPNQNYALCSPAELLRDINISESLKDICKDADQDVRDHLLMGGLDDIAQKGTLMYFAAAVTDAITGTLSEDQVIEELIKRLSVKLPDNKDLTEESRTIQNASVRLLSHLWDTKGETATSIAQRVPLITSRQRAVLWTQTQMMMAPVRNWHESARPFAGAYPEQRILADLYLGSEDGQIPNVVTPLVNWRIAFPDPLIQDTPSGLTQKRLSVLGIGEIEGVTVNDVGNQTFSQIALLQPEVLNHCEEGTDEARSLLGLVLCYIAPNDNTWRESRIVKGRKGGQDVKVMVTGALWLADLKIRAWVPLPGEDDKPIKMMANRATLERLGIDPSWLSGNDAAIELLSNRFEFDELELRLLTTTADKTMSLQIRNGLAKLVEIGGPNPEFFTSLVEQVKEQQRRSRDVNKARRLGLAVQEAVASAMDKCGLKLKLIDKEFDYEVILEAEGSIEDAATRLNFGPYLLEVKATTTGSARMTPPQATRASTDADRYVLCVVDLRGLLDDALEREWTASRIEPLAKIVSDIGYKTVETCSLIQDATTKPVGIRNESALRYNVPISVWESGVSISTWVKSISTSQRK